MSETIGVYAAQFPPETASVVATRRLVGEACAGLRIDPTVAKDAALVASELATNAVLHAGGYFGVSIRRLGPGLRIEVGDSSPRLPLVDSDDLLANRSMTGRGLALVAACADRWGADPDSRGGKVTWAEVGTGRRLVAVALARATVEPELPPVAAAAGVTLATSVTAGGRQVHLVGVPVGLLVESSQHFADLRRELQLMALDHDGPVELHGVVEVGRQVASEMDPWTAFDPAALEAALARGDDRVSYDITVPVDAADRIDRLAVWMGRLRSSLVRRYLLTEPPPEDVTAYRLWFREELTAQLNGRDPEPCPLAVRPEEAVHR